MPLVEIDTGATLHYEDTDPNGDLTPVILIHGMLGTARGHLGHVIDWLAAQGFRAIGVTLRGYGQSLPKPRDFPNNFYHRDCDDLLAFMNAIDIPKAHLIGYSDGGEVALIAAGIAPSRLLRHASPSARLAISVPSFEVSFNAAIRATGSPTKTSASTASPTQRSSPAHGCGP